MDIKQELAVKIAGEIVVSKDPNKSIKKWREIFGATQHELAQRLRISASVISDYESGRRRSPGTRMVSKIVSALIASDEKRGAQVLRAYERMLGANFDGGAILDMREFASPMKAKDMCRIVGGTAIANKDLLNKDIYGYTALDSIKAILELNSDEFLRIYGLTSERALIFTRVSSGRSPFIAIRVAQIKPGLVVLHGLDKVDELGIKIAQKERIPVILSRIESTEELLKELRRNT